jgi:hypothetical protein
MEISLTGTRLRIVCALLAAFCFLAPSARAWDAYTAQKVEGFAQGANATEARAKAMEQAEKKAFDMVAGQLQLGDPAKFAGLKPDQISRMVTGYEVVEEQAGQGTYRAVVHVTFSPAQIRAVTGVTPRPGPPPPEVIAAEAEAKAKAEAKRAADAAQKASDPSKPAAQNDEMAAALAREAEQMNKGGTPLARSTDAAKTAKETTSKDPSAIPTPSGTPVLQASQLTKLQPAYTVQDAKGTVPSRPLESVVQEEKPSSIASTMERLAAPKVPAPLPAAPSAENARRMGVLLVPVLRKEGQPMLWEDTNVWRAAWQRQPLAGSRPALILPDGDVEDIAQLDVGQIDRGDRSGLQHMAHRYRAAEVLLMDASLLRLSSGNQLQVRLVPVSIGVTPRMAAAQFAVASMEHPGKLMEMAVAEALKRMNQPTNVVKLAETTARKPGVAPSLPEPSIPANQPEKIKLVIPLGSMAEWVRLRQGLESMPEVERLEIIAMSPSQADIWVNLKTSANQFSHSLGTRGYQCLPREGYWILKADRPQGAPGSS